MSVAFQTFDGNERIHLRRPKITRIAFGLVCNHPFVDGNKRIGTYVMMVLLELNRIAADCSDDAIIRIGLELADGKMRDKQPLAIILERSK